MNRLHHWYCRSAAWRRKVESEIVPWALDGVQLGGPALEIGPGPGLTTDYLRARVGPLTVLERDPLLAGRLRARLRDVEVVEGDAARMPFTDGRFRTVFCFTMLHHVPSAELQDCVLREAARVLAPGGAFVGTDSRMSLRMKIFHCFDTLVIVKPEAFPQRLGAAGLVNPQIEISGSRFRFRAMRADGVPGAEARP